MLDSWVRYEGQVKQRQQKELAENVIGKITKELENPKTLQQILQQSVADVESESNLETIPSVPHTNRSVQRSYHLKLSRRLCRISKCTLAQFIVRHM